MSGPLVVPTRPDWGVCSLPGFVESLRLLIERERYTHIDIALMFGISRERVRQLCNRSGIQHPDARGNRGLRCRRVWDDDANRFQPVPKRELEQNRLAEQRQSREARRADKRRRLVRAVSALRATLGRDPLWREVCDALNIEAYVCHGGATSSIVAYWGRGTSGTTAGVIREICRATGVTPRKRGRVAGSRVASPVSERERTHG